MYDLVTLVRWLSCGHCSVQVPYQLEFAEWLSAEGPEGGAPLAEQLLLTAAGVLTELVDKGNWATVALQGIYVSGGHPAGVFHHMCCKSLIVYVCVFLLPNLLPC